MKKINFIRGIKTYCYHCGKILNEGDEIYNGHIHYKCAMTRIKMNYALKSERWRLLLLDKNIRKKIEEIDKKVLSKFKNATNKTQS